MSNILRDTSILGADSGSGGSGGGANVARGSTVAALNATPEEERNIGIITVGTHPDTHDEWLYWDSTLGKWVGEAKVQITQQDNWAMDLANKTASQLLDWSYVDNPVPYGRAYARITGAHNLSAANFDIATKTGVITVNTTAPNTSGSGHAPYNFTPQGGTNTGPGSWLFLRDNIIGYTGITATTFTGCWVEEGSRGTIPDQEYIVQGYSSGWGFVVSPVLFAGELFSAGLMLQEKLTGLLNGGPTVGAVTEKDIIVAPYWYQYNQGDAQVPPQHEVPPVSGMGVGATLTSPTGSGGGAPGDERPFHVSLNEWTDWALLTPTKHALIPILVAKMATGGIYTGSVLDILLTVRWTADG